MPQCSSAKGKTNKHELNQETSLDEPIDSPIIYENINFLLIIIFFENTFFKCRHSTIRVHALHSSVSIIFASR